MARKDRKLTVERIRKMRKARDQRMIRDFRPPEGVVLNFEVASVGARFGAQLLDIILTSLAVLSIVILMLVTGLAWADPFFGSSSALTIIFSLLFFFIRAPYYILMELIWNGQTLGKRLSGLRVVSADGRSLRPYAVTVRNMMKEMEVFVPGTALFAAEGLSTAEIFILLIWITILLIVPFTNKKRQRMGDMIAGTYVINQPKSVLLPDMAKAQTSEPGEEFTFLAHQLDHYGAFELQTLERVLQADLSNTAASGQSQRQKDLQAITDNITRKIEFTDPIGRGREEAFLRAFYRAQRQYLETRKLFGEAREDKFHKHDGDEPTA
ncbi:MAG: RDD family protein [Pseudomonadota bacterium]